MLRTTKIQMLLVLVAGAAMGYAAASGKLNPFGRAEAAPPGQPAAADKAGGSRPAATPTCCSQGDGRGQLLAMANPRVREAVARVEGNGKKPNIVVIMGDDVGIWNIGAY